MRPIPDSIPTCCALLAVTRQITHSSAARPLECHVLQVRVALVARLCGDAHGLDAPQHRSPRASPCRIARVARVVHVQPLEVERLAYILSAPDPQLVLPAFDLCVEIGHVGGSWALPPLPLRLLQQLDPWRLRLVTHVPVDLAEKLVILGQDENHWQVLAHVAHKVPDHGRDLPSDVMQVQHRTQRRRTLDVLHHQWPPRFLPLLLHLMISRW